MKFVKFGYGRASDHACKDIRTGYMTREKGIEMVRKYDHVIPSSLNYWLDYVGMKEEEFWKVANGFRDPNAFGEKRTVNGSKIISWDRSRSEELSCESS